MQFNTLNPLLIGQLAYLTKGTAASLATPAKIKIKIKILRTFRRINFFKHIYFKNIAFIPQTLLL